MSVEPCGPQVEFPPGHDDFDTPARGYLSHVIVKCSDGAAYKVYFIDPVRLQQTLQDDAAAGRPYFAEPGLIVLPEVTTDAVKKAVTDLWRDGFFQSLKPV